MLVRDSSTDVLIAGAGPSGLALASELARRGVSVTVADPKLAQPWRASYGAWSRSLRGQKLDDALSGRYSTGVVRVDGADFILNESYVRFESESLQTLLRERARDAGVQFVPTCAQDVLKQGQLVIYATGPGRQNSPCYQTAYGVWLEDDLWTDEVRERVDLNELELMDYREMGNTDKRTPSFLYSMVEQRHGKRQLFCQETVLVGETVANFQMLRERLKERLSRRGLKLSDERFGTFETEYCVIPMGQSIPEPGAAGLPFGVAAGLTHPATGYQLARSLILASRVAEAIAEAYDVGNKWINEAMDAAWEVMWPEDQKRAWALYRWGALILAQFNAQQMQSFMKSFFSLDSSRWLAFMEADLSSPQVLGVMWDVFRSDPSLRWPLLGHSARQSTTAFRQALNRVPAIAPF